MSASLQPPLAGSGIRKLTLADATKIAKAVGTPVHNLAHLEVLVGRVADLVADLDPEQVAFQFGAELSQAEEWLIGIGSQGRALLSPQGLQQALERLEQEVEGYDWRLPRSAQRRSSVLEAGNDVLAAWRILAQQNLSDTTPAR